MAAGVCEEVLVQVSYAIGVVEPMGLYVNTHGTANVDISDGEIAKIVVKLFDMRPAAIERRLKLRKLKKIKLLKMKEKLNSIKKKKKTK